MLNYNQRPIEVISLSEKTISCFEIGTSESSNIDKKTVESFGHEWSKFSTFSEEEITNIGNEYFDLLDESILNSSCTALDLGAGAGRWTKYLAKHVNFIEAIDPSNAVFSALSLLKNSDNTRVTKASVDNIPFYDESFDLGISLGVLHHIPNTQKALRKLVKKVKIDGHVLIYLYYNLDNKGFVYKLIFKFSTYPRLLIAKFPDSLKKLTCDIIAVTVYAPLIMLSYVIKWITFGSQVFKIIPLSYYVGKSFNVIRNDALDRFGTPLEQRFSKIEINTMMKDCGLHKIRFSDKQPFWHAVGKRKS
jgi:ubiquinone/menaquinone biosynthesis C-methylase UbiE